MNRIYWKGKLWPWKKIRVSPLNTGLFFGENLFEAVPVCQGRPLFLEEHLRRLKKGCDFLGWPFLPKAEFIRAVTLFAGEAGLRANFMVRFNLVQELQGKVHPRFFAREAPTLLATTRPLRHDPSSPSPPRGKAGISPWLAADAKTLPNEFKISFYLTTRADFRSNPDWDEVLRLNRKGEVVDGGTSTPMWFNQKEVLVPPLNLGGLASVTRFKIMELLQELGIAVAEKAWKTGDVFKKRGELFFVGSGVGIMSPTHLQGRRINKTNPLALRLWQYYRKWALPKLF